jgi:feruloyl esterase
MVALAIAGTLAGSSQCEQLKSLTLPNTTILSAQAVPAGPFIALAPPGVPGRANPAPPAAPAAPGRGVRGGPGAAPPPLMLPAHCRVAAVVTPSADSKIAVEVWLPSENWNGKFEAVGNGGWAGIISYPAMATALRDGYATASTDTGHTGGNAMFAIGHPEKLVDFAYRAVHELTVQSKAIVNAFYGRAPRLSYWNGCSTGGRQGLIEAQKFPADFDAILAGAPANYQTHLHVWDLSVSVPVLKDPAEAVPPAKLALLNSAVLAACDAKDGVKDGLINDPRACTFDPATLLCHGGESDRCLTQPQVDAVRRVYAPAKTASGEVVFPGKEPGSETGWGSFLGGQQAPAVSVGSFQVAYQDANWDPRTFDLNRDLPRVDDTVGSIVNAINPDLQPFKARGGKLLLYHGWNDTAISPGNTIDYYSSVLSKMGPNQDTWVRLFMEPGMQHCGGGPGPNQVNWMAALERWREAGTPPQQIAAAHVSGNRVDMTRPLCPYPQVAAYAGVGTTDDAANFVCKAP